MRFRMLVVMAAVLAVPGLAVAQSDSTDMGTSPGSMGSSMGGSQSSSGMGGMDQGSDVRTGMQMNAQEVELFKAHRKENFELKGTVSSVDPSNNTITLTRERNLPPVELQVAQGTEIKWEGKSASLNQLEPGSEVRARFNVANDQPLAIEIDAKQSKGQKKMERESDSMNR